MTRPLAAAAGLVADRLAGEPPEALHPVAGFGTALQALERFSWRDTRAAGSLHLGAGLALALVSGARLRSTAAATWLAVGGSALWQAAEDVAAALDGQDLDSARRALPSLVGRDPDGLDEKGIVRAVVESVAENTVDAIVAPALWAAVAGASGVLGYRAVNTLDAMVGHHSARYERFGWASARADDLAAWVPARVTAALVGIVRPRAAGAVWRAVRTQAPSHPSPNAGVAEAAFAAALGVTLGGTNAYGDRVEARPPLGDGPAPAQVDIRRAVRLSSDVSWALTAGLAVAAAMLSGKPRPASDRG